MTKSAARLLSRRTTLGFAAAASLAGCGSGARWHDIDVSGMTPPLSLTMRRAPDGSLFTAQNARGELTLLYFGYTYCPDICPLTLQNVSRVFARMGSLSANARLLFVTVDPGRDTLALLGQYMALFGPNFIGLRGSADALSRLARRYRIAYSVTPNPDPQKYTVTHSALIYVFDQSGAARLMVPSLASASPDIAGVTADLKRLARGRPRPAGWLETLV
jgi:protein SCO1/2